jgi:hypothetical protein
VTSHVGVHEIECLLLLLLEGILLGILDAVGPPFIITGVQLLVVELAESIVTA